MTVKTYEADQSIRRQGHSSLSDVVIGVLLGIDDTGVPLVVFPGNESGVGVPARSTATLCADDIGCEVALLFENGDAAKPLVIGRVQNPQRATEQRKTATTEVEVDGERVEFNAKQEIVLKCGKASITLTKAGKVLIRGTYLLSRSSGANRIKGGSIQLN